MDKTGLENLAQEEYCYLTTMGRVSGKPHRIEIWFGTSPGTSLGTASKILYLLSGGGLRMGQVVGATNSKAEYPTQSPYTPQDLLATIYGHLGIDIHRTYVNPAGRPIALSTGTTIAGL